MERSYNPKNYNDFLGRNMEKAYRILETKQAEREYGELQCAVDNIYFEIKEMIKWNEIEPDYGRNMQEYFLSFLE